MHYSSTTCIFNLISKLLKKICLAKKAEVKREFFGTVFNLEMTGAVFCLIEMLITLSTLHFPDTYYLVKRNKYFQFSFRVN